MEGKIRHWFPLTGHVHKDCEPMAPWGPGDPTVFVMAGEETEGGSGPQDLIGR